MNTIGLWSKADEMRLRELAQTGTMKQAVQEFGRKHQAVHRKMLRLGLRFQHMSSRYGATIKPWTKKDEAALRFMVGEVSIGEMAARLGRTRRGVTAKLAALGITRKRNTYSMEQAAALLGVSNKTVYAYRNRLHLQCGRIVGKSYTPGATLDDVLRIANAILSNPRANIRASARRLRQVVNGEVGP